MMEALIRAPESLDATSRVPFKATALEALERLGDARPDASLVIDMAGTQRVDSAGLGTLVMLQLRAAEHRHDVRLRNASEEIRFLLLMTRLDDKFVIEPPSGG